MAIQQQSIIHNTIIDHPDNKFHDALDEFPSVDASNSFEKPSHSISSSEQDINEDESTSTATVTFISEHSPDSPSSPSAAGLRHRRLVIPPNHTELYQSQFFKNNPDSLIDFDPLSASDSRSSGKKYKRSVSLKNDEKLSDEVDSSSVITSVSDGQRVNDESITVDSPNSGPDFLMMLVELVIEIISFQTKLLAKSFNFMIWLLYSSYMLVNDPYGVVRNVRGYVQGGIFGIWGICYDSGVKLINWFQANESLLKLFVRIGWGLLWLVYCGLVLVCLLVPAFVFGGVVVKWVVEEPVQINEQLSFDYTKDTPTAFARVISCLESSYAVNNVKSEIGRFDGSRIIPFGHELKATVSLVLPESDYNRHLGVFQVRVDFLSTDGKLLASTRKPCMLQFKSEPIRVLSTFLKLADFLTGYPSETQTLVVTFSGYTEKDIPLSCLRVVFEQRAEFVKGAGVPEIYSASLQLESQFPFLKRMVWYWKGLIYMWISMMMFIMELLFTLFCCAPIIFPWVRRVGGGSLVNDASHNGPLDRS